MYGERPESDLTARARIVDAALAEIGQRGARGATMRSIADAAGVSVGLVQHHFGTKDGVRAACDERVLDLVRLKVANSGPGGGLGDAQFLDRLYRASTPVMPYVAQVALADDDRAGQLFDEIVALTSVFFGERFPDRFPVEHPDTRAAASALTAMNLGILLMHHQLARALGLPDDEPRPSPRIGAATLDAFRAVGAVLASSLGDEITAALDSHVIDEGGR